MNADYYHRNRGERVTKKSERSNFRGISNWPANRQSGQSRPSKLEWKRQTRQAMLNYWTTSLVTDAMAKTTHSHCSIGNLKIGHTHMVWDSIQPNLQDLKRGHTKARLLTGTCMFQSTKYKFNSSEVDPRCPLCRLESEDLQHFILRCPALTFHS